MSVRFDESKLQGLTDQEVLSESVKRGAFARVHGTRKGAATND